MVRLSEHFSLEELTRSEVAMRRGADNTPNAGEVANLKRLCELLLEPARALLGVPFHINSGFRCPVVNALVGGAVGSAHQSGLAADFYPVGLTLQDAFHVLAVSSLPYDQIILECGAWIHLAAPNVGADARRVVMTASGSPGHWVYTRVSA